MNDMFASASTAISTVLSCLDRGGSYYPLSNGMLTRGEREKNVTINWLLNGLKTPSFSGVGTTILIMVLCTTLSQNNIASERVNCKALFKYWIFLSYFLAGDVFVVTLLLYICSKSGITLSPSQMHMCTSAICR